MAKKLIRLTENDLHRVVKESAYRILNEIERSRPGDIPPGDGDVHYPGDINPDVHDALARGDFGEQTGNKEVANMWKKQYETCMLRVPELLEKLKTYALEGNYSKANNVWEYELAPEIQTLETAKWQVENNPNGGRI